jgi:cysteine desulfurase
METLLIALIVILILVLWYWSRSVSKPKSIFDKLYFDNNGTTQPHREVVEEMSKNAWLGNASSSYAWDAKKKLEDLRVAVLKWCRAGHHKVIITSGASEANNMIIRSMVDRHWRVEPASGRGIGVKPHIIMSSIEHKTSIECAKLLQEEGRLEVTFVEPDIYGNISPQDVAESINSRTILISIMSANNETGNLMPVQEIAKLAAARAIPFHTDAVQTFGKHQPHMKNISGLSMSFHKMHGPQGIGVLVLDNDLAAKLEGQIAGTQNFGLRGGTENMAAVAGALKSMHITLAERASKNQHMLNMKHFIMKRLTEAFRILPVEKFAGKTDEEAEATAAVPVAGTVRHNYKDKAPKGLVVLGATNKLGLPDDMKVNPNTLLVSVVNLRNNPNVKYEKFCNIKFKSDLAADGAIVSIGSACQTGEKGSSHVLNEMGLPFVVRCGVIRISMSDYNTIGQAETFCKKFIDAAWLQ